MAVILLYVGGGLNNFKKCWITKTVLKLKQ